MRKLLLLIIIVIILVSLNWFREAIAQDLSNLSDQDKASLLKRYHAKLPDSAKGSESYRTPTIFEANDSVGVPRSATRPAPSDSLRVATSTDKLTPFEQLKPFGQELFGGPRETTPPADIASSGDYILGPGDNVIVSLWGRVEQEYNLTVDREGKVFIPKVGEISA